MSYKNGAFCLGQECCLGNRLDGILFLCRCAAYAAEQSFLKVPAGKTNFMPRKAAEWMIIMRNDYLIRKTVLLYLVPSIGMIMAATIGVTVDGIITANMLGSTALQALNMAMPFILFLVSVSSVIGMGGSILAGTAFGKNNPKEANNIFTLSVALTLLCSVVIMCLVNGFLDQIVAALSRTDEIGVLLQEYLRGLLFVVFPALFVQIFTNFATIDSDPGISVLSIFAMTATNITLDIVFTSVLHMGMFGMGLATSISYFVGMFVAAGHFFKKSNSLRLTRLSFSTLKKTPSLLWTGLPTAVSMFGSSVQVVVLNLFLAGLNVAGGLTAYAVQNNVFSLSNGVLLGVGLCIGPMISVFYGENDHESIRLTLRNALKIGLILSFVSAMILAVFSRQIAGVFGIFEGIELAQSIVAIRWLALGFPLAMINIILGALYQNTAQTVPSIVVSLGRTCLFIGIWIPLSAGWLGTTTVWMNLIVSESATFILLSIIYSLKNKKLVFTPETMTYFPPTPSAETIYDISIQDNFTEITKIAEQLQDFAIAHNMEPRMAYCIALSTEEMARNIVQYGFHDKKTHFIDVRLIWNSEDKTCCMRLRDDGIMFNPLVQKEEDVTNDPFDNIGIRMISNMVDSIDYRYCVGMNNLIIKFKSLS